jgi:hypothetical protein
MTKGERHLQIYITIVTRLTVTIVLYKIGEWLLINNCRLFMY